MTSKFKTGDILTIVTCYSTKDVDINTSCEVLNIYSHPSEKFIYRFRLPNNGFRWLPERFFEKI